MVIMVLLISLIIKSSIIYISSFVYGVNKCALVLLLFRIQYIQIVLMVINVLQHQYLIIITKTQTIYDNKNNIWY